MSRTTAIMEYVRKLRNDGNEDYYAHRDAIESAVEALERELAEKNNSLSETVNERDEARGAAVKANRAVERLHGLLREMKAAMLGYPMSTRALSPTRLLEAINKELREPAEAPK